MTISTISSAASGPQALPLPAADDVEAAAGRLAGQAVMTPLLENPLLNDRLGGRLLIKAECLQRTGSFKFRGAFNRLSQIPADERGRGVVAFSSGNHAQGVAAAARLLGIPATIVMPSDAPRLKRANTVAWGARVVDYDRLREDREAIGGKIAEETGATIVPPYDDPDIIAGQGTVGLEIARQCDELLGAAPDAVLVPASGGGLTAGVALAISRHAPGADIHTVEPAGFDDMARSLEAGTRQSNKALGGSLCDALMSPTPGVLTFAIGKRLLAPGLVVTDEEACEAMAVAARELKLVLEPGGAVAVAAVLTGKIAIAGRTVVAVASGGNVDPAFFAKVLAAE